MRVKEEERKKKEGSRMYQLSPYACSYIKPYRIHKTSLRTDIVYKITVFYTGNKQSENKIKEIISLIT